MTHPDAQPAPSGTPRADGFRMPPEWAPHQSCLMAWPTRRSLWEDQFEQAKRDYELIARTIAEFEPVIMICRPGAAREVRDRCGAEITVLEIEIDDSWTRDSGPVFVTSDQGEVAIVDFGFDSWGGKYLPCADDAALTARLASLLGIRRYQAPLVLEGGAFFVDGEGTMFTTEGPLLDPRRNPGITKARVEAVAADYLGADQVLWLVAAPDRDTDGHIDGIAQLIEPGRLLLEIPSDPGNENYGPARENLRRLGSARDGRGRPVTAVPFDVPAAGAAGSPGAGVSYLNCYLANGAVVVPVAGNPADELALHQIQAAFPGRTIAGVPGTTLAFGGGGPHCITQQMPAGRPVPA